jgi:hypothetical protein
MLGWIETEIKDTFHRNLCIDYALACNKILKNLVPRFDDNEEDLEYIEIAKAMTNFRFQILREYGRSD